MDKKGNTTETGRKFELWAADYLCKQGYQLVQRNFRSGRNEIDLVMQWGATLVFVEVKGRKVSRFGPPEAAVGDAKRERLLDAAADYQHQKNWKGPIRFDVVAFEVNEEGKAQLRHFQDAL